MFEETGNQIALQYGGSQLANTMTSWTKDSIVSQIRDLNANLKRYYSNSFADTGKQVATLTPLTSSALDEPVSGQLPAKEHKNSSLGPRIRLATAQPTTPRAHPSLRYTLVGTAAA